MPKTTRPTDPTTTAPTRAAVIADLAARLATPVDVRSIVRHRNGVGGTGFHFVVFVHEGTTLHAVVTDRCEDDATGSVNVFVTDPTDPTSCWRGDAFARPLRAAVRAWEATR